MTQPRKKVSALDDAPALRQSATAVLAAALLWYEGIEQDDDVALDRGTAALVRTVKNYRRCRARVEAAPPPAAADISDAKLKGYLERLHATDCSKANINQEARRKRSRGA